MKDWSVRRELRRLVLLVAGIALPAVCPAGADTVYLQDGSEVKGVVVEEFADRVTLRTESGTQEILMEQIVRVQYDTTEQHYVRLGDLAFDQGLYDEAMRQYQQAIDASPDAPLARRRLAAVQGAVRYQRDEALRARITQQEALVGRRLWIADPEASTPDPEQQVWERLGLALESDQGIFRVGRVGYVRPADQAGIREGDRLVSIWGRLIQYTPRHEVVRRLVEGPDYSEVQVTIERELDIPRGFPGMTVALRDEGLVVATVDAEATGPDMGLQVGDRIVSVDGQETRYMPMPEVHRILKADDVSPTARVTLRRNLSLWRQPLTSRGDDR